MEELHLWDELKAGNKQALERIYRSTVRLLYNYGCKFSRDKQLVEDTIQDLFIEIWKNRAGLGTTDSIERYLLAAIRRKIFRQLTKLRKIDLAESDDQYPFSAELSFENKIIGLEVDEENEEKIKQAFASLSKRQKEAVYLKYYAGLDYEEIEEVMSISYQSARNLVSGGLKKMRETVSITVLFYFLEIFKFF